MKTGHVVSRSFPAFAVLAAFIWLAQPGASRADITLTQGPLTITFNDAGGRIDSLLFNGLEVYRLGTFVSDWGLSVFTNPPAFVINQARTTPAQQPMTRTVTTPSSVTYVGLYSNVYARLLLTRTFEFVPGQNTLRTRVLIQNQDAASVSVQSFDTFDPDFASVGGGVAYTTANDRYTILTNSIVAYAGRSTVPGLQTTALLGTTDPSAIIGASRTASGWFVIQNNADLGAILQASGADSNGGTSDTSLDILWSFDLGPGATREMEYFHSFGTTVAAAEQAFVLSIATNIPPAIISQPQDRIVSENESFNLSVLASGSGALRYQWYFNGSAIPDETNAVLAFAAAQVTNNGSYFATVTNFFGSATTRVATVVVHAGPPVIDQQPQSLDRLTGQSAIFNVLASGSQPIRYQWRHDGLDIPDATNTTLARFNLKAGDAGVYTVLVSNQYASVLSAPAVLTVTVVGGPPDTDWMSGGHSFEVNCVAFSPDGSTVVSTADDNTAKLWRVSDGTLLHTFLGHNNDVRSAAFSPDGKRLATGSKDDLIRVWDVESGGLVTNAVHNDIRCVAFSPDGLLVASAAGASASTVKVIDATNGLLRTELFGHAGDVRTVAFSRDGAWLASGGQDGILRIWRATNSPVWPLEKSINIGTNIYSVAWASNGLSLAAGLEDHTVKIYEPLTGSLIRTLTGHTDSIRTIAYSADGATLASGSWDSRIKLWNAGSGALIRTINEGERVRSVAFAPNGATLAVGNKGNQVRLRQVSNGALLRTLTENLDIITSQAVSPDGSLLAVATADNLVKVWRTTNHTLFRSFNGASRALTFSHDGTMLAGGSTDSSINLWNLNTGLLLQSLYGHDEEILDLAFTPDDTTLWSASADDSLSQWQVSDGGLLDTIGLRPFDVGGIALAEDASLALISFYGLTPIIVSLPEGALLQQLGNAYPYGSAVAFSPDRTRVAVWPYFYSGPLQYFRVSDGLLLGTISKYNYSSNAPLAFSPDSQVLVSGGPDLLEFHDVNTGLLKTYYNQQIGWPMQTVFTPDASHFSLGRADATALFARAPLAPVRLTSLSRSGRQVILRWAGGGPPYQVQMRTNLLAGSWFNLGPAVSGFSATNTISDGTAFFRVKPGAN